MGIRSQLEAVAVGGVSFLTAGCEKSEELAPASYRPFDEAALELTRKANAATCDDVLPG